MAYHIRLWAIGLAMIPIAAAQACEAGKAPVASSAAVASPVPDAGVLASVVSAPITAPVARSHAPAEGGACGEAFATDSACKTLRTLIATTDQRADLRTCLLDGGLHVTPPPPENQSELCYWQGPLLIAPRCPGCPSGGRGDCLLGNYGGDAVTCYGDDKPGIVHYKAFIQMAKECLAGWKIENHEKLTQGSAGLPGVAFEVAVPERDGEKVTRVQVCQKANHAPEDDEPSEAVVVDIFTTHRGP